MSIREKIKFSDYRRIAQENEYFIWHFLQKDQGKSTLGLISYFDDLSDQSKFHHMKYFLDNVDIPYFESYTEESIDFLLDFNLNPTLLYVADKPSRAPQARKRKFSPLLMVFNKYKLFGTSLDKCYCVEYLIEMVYNLNPKFILESKFD